MTVPSGPVAPSRCPAHPLVAALSPASALSPAVVRGAESTGSGDLPLGRAGARPGGRTGLAGAWLLHAPLAHSLCPALCLGMERPRWRLQPRGWEPADGAVARRPVTAAGVPGVPPLSRTRTLCPSEASPAPATSATPGFAQDPSSGPGRSPVLTCPPAPVLTVTRALAGVSANT